MIRKWQSALVLPMGLWLGGCAVDEPITYSPSEIIDGTVDSGDSSVVMLRFANGAGFCSGTLISPAVVLTAAHCVDLGPSSVGFGVKGIDSPVAVKEIHVPPAWDGNYLNGNDIGVVILDHPVTFVTPSPIARRAGDRPANGARVRIVGYGYNASSGGFGSKRQATTSVLSASDRLLVLLGLTSNQKCYGDEGGPSFFVGADGVEHVVGVSSYIHGHGCGHGSTDTRVDAYFDFIDQYVPPFDLESAKTATGDFNGDGFADELVLYDYDNESAGLWVFPGGTGGNNSSVPYRVWFGRQGSFDVKQSKVTAGDFNGDGKSDLIVIYDYSKTIGPAAAGVFVFPGTAVRGDRASAPFEVWFGDPGSYDVSKAKVAAGDFTGDSKADLLVLYDNSENGGAASAGVWVFPGTTTRATGPYEVWHGVAGSFDVSKAKVAAGDFDGDGQADLLALYDYGSTIGPASAGLFVFPGTASPTLSNGPYEVWFGQPGSFDINEAKVTAGDFNGDGKVDLLALYDEKAGFGWASAGLYVFPGTSSRGPSTPYRSFFSGPGSFDVNRTKVSAGDYNADGFADVIATYDYTGLGFKGADLYVFPGSTGTNDSSTVPYTTWSWSRSGPAF